MRGSVGEGRRGERRELWWSERGGEVWNREGERWEKEGIFGARGRKVGVNRGGGME